MDSVSDTERERLQREGTRQYEVVDRLLSMHAVLRDGYKRRALGLNTGQVGVSLFLSIFAFVSDEVLRSLGYEPDMARFVVGLSAAVVLLLSITEFRVDWRMSATRHDEAAECLAKLKARYRRSAARFGDGVGSDHAGLTADYEKAMADLPAIPERLFGRLKAAHEFKRALSRRIEENPLAPWWLLRTRLRLEGALAALRLRGDGE